MALTAGTRLGHYDVTALLGEGGMGQVWQATDTQLGRQVALKILSDAFASDHDRLARFQREAQVLASLNHPNIAAIHGIEEAEGTRALVLELVEGPTLADRIKQGPIPVDEALPIAKQIAEALEAAHEAGVIHRDLKPANIKVRSDGTVKVLDFGLAKALDPTPTGDPSQSPTLTAAATQMGVIMGTAAYMSPEQARGSETDHRADIWSFGAVLYEMLTGSRAFGGQTVSDTLASILKTAPEWSPLPGDTPAPVRNLLRHCLDRDRKERLQHVGDARVELRDALNSSLTDTAGAAGWASNRRSGMSLAVGAVIGALGAGLVVWTITRSEAVPSEVVRFEIVPPDTAPLFVTANHHEIAISRDGSRVVYSGLYGSTRPALYLRAIDQLAGERIPGTGQAVHPFLSPDGEWVGYLSGEDLSALHKVSIFGRDDEIVTQSESTIRGASWGEDGQIVFGTLNGGLFRVRDDDGQPEPLTSLSDELGETGHGWPAVLPGGEGVLFVVSSGLTLTTGRVAVLNLGTGEVIRLGIPGLNPQFVSTGHLVYATRTGSVLAVLFDEESLSVTGEPIALLEDVTVKPTGAANFSISDNGHLAYVMGGATSPVSVPRVLVWVDREGREEEIAMPQRPYYAARVSPEGGRVAVEVREENVDVWVHDLVRGTQTRLTRDPGLDRFPVWHPDGERIAFSSDRLGGPLSVFWKQAIGTGAAELILSEADKRLDAWSWTPDGRSLLLNEAGTDVSVVTLDGDRVRQPLLAEGFAEGAPEISPDGRWIAYRSSESGRLEIYVRPYPDVGSDRLQVSTEGGNYPAWSPDGRELFYRALDGSAVMGVRVDTTPTLTAGIPAPVVEGDYVYAPGQGRNWDISLDGQRFLMLKEADQDGADSSASRNITVVLNWHSELLERVPVP